MRGLICMMSLRVKFGVLTLGGVIALTGAGCVGPLAPPTFGQDASKSAPPAATSNSSTATLPAQVDQVSVPPDMASVLDKIQQVRAIDPSAEPRLLEELRRVPPSTWPLVAEQFRASLAYHEQLEQRGRTSPREIQPVVDLRRASRTDFVAGAEPRRIPSTDLAYDTSESTTHDRPSAPIGALADPHGANSEAANALARSMPYAMPSPLGVLVATQTDPAAPAPFAADGPTYPIVSRNGPKTELAAGDADSADRHVARQAAAEVIDAPRHLPKPSEESGDNSNGSKAPVPLQEGEGSKESWQQSVQKAVADLERHVSPSPTTTAEVHQHVSLRMLRLLAGDTEKALEPIPHISPTEQDYWSRQLFALATYLDHHSQPDDKRRAAASVTHLDDAVANLRELGALTLRNLSFCKNVYGYGSFESYDSDAFTPGQHVSLYVEVENFRSTSSDKGFNTSLGSTYEVLDDKGKRVASGDFPDVNDCCRNRRRDFHIQFGLTLPENVQPGRYQLQLVVKDHQSDKIGNAKASFEIRGKK
jgi:hypothetical protein